MSGYILRWYAHLKTGMLILGPKAKLHFLALGFCGLGLEFLALALNAMALEKITRPTAISYK